MAAGGLLVHVRGGRYCVDRRGAAVRDPLGAAGAAGDGAGRGGGGGEFGGVAGVHVPAGDLPGADPSVVERVCAGLRGRWGSTGRSCSSRGTSRTSRRSC